MTVSFSKTEIISWVGFPLRNTQPVKIDLIHSKRTGKGKGEGRKREGMLTEEENKRLILRDSKYRNLATIILKKENKGNTKTGGL